MISSLPKLPTMSSEYSIPTTSVAASGASAAAAMATTSTSASSSNSKKVILLSSDGKEFEVDEAVAKKSRIISNCMETMDDVFPTDVSVFPIYLVESSILCKVLEYCKKHVESEEEGSVASAKEDLKKWDELFVKATELDGTLPSLIVAVDYLDIGSLLDQLVCLEVTADNIEEIKSLEGVIKEILILIKNDFTPEEQEELRSAASIIGPVAGVPH